MWEVLKELSNTSINEFYAVVKQYLKITSFRSQSRDRITDCSPINICSCDSDGIVAVLLQSCYDVAGRFISDQETAPILNRTIFCSLFLPYNCIAIDY